MPSGRFALSTVLSWMYFRMSSMGAPFANGMGTFSWSFSQILVASGDMGFAARCTTGDGESGALSGLKAPPTEAVETIADGWPARIDGRSPIERATRATEAIPSERIQFERFIGKAPRCR